MTTLKNETLSQLPAAVQTPLPVSKGNKNHILHIGVGAFHRAHQAYTWHQLRQRYPQQYADWTILGVCLMPADRAFVQQFEEQDYLYTLRMRAADGNDDVVVIDSITEVLYGPDDTAAVIHAIAHVDTRIISFTITEGGYNTDFDNHQFIWSNAHIQHDLEPGNPPKTVFGYLARGLAERKEKGVGGLVLMSCDNIQENGHVLKHALLAFLERYDPTLRNWAADHVSFPNSMVDRITPASTSHDKDDFESCFGLRDNLLVVSEDFFQWVLEDTGLIGIPPLDEVGVQLVDDVRPYEAMKLSILNAGHSLVGLLGDALGYTKIHDAIRHPQIAAVFERYAIYEAIPVLPAVAGVDLQVYFRTVRSRFSNAMINDATARIISGSSDKIPKFLLPVVHRNLQTKNSNIDIAALVVAAWWYYLYRANRLDDMRTVIDNKRDELKALFDDESVSFIRFLQYRPVFGNLSANPLFVDSCKHYAASFLNGKMEDLLRDILGKLR
ncbi:mannitol dehydrogenase family protein [Parapedobacter sp. 10938]|uniref:mannitol dehydrogenase family protein n=1 Tax=Parapedobacter flavus TaxID=3110225 RepID=UPI002DB967C5|nr:mannitol dehydrogenase family protein [Parapedobacter sp. 10938]MEC3878122.1 mannitol dehydrogenase family protein [Parapedobacter sp. 10938]